jgi:hypothetical protein
MNRNLWVSALFGLLMFLDMPNINAQNLNPVPITPRTDNLFTISGFVPRFARTPAELRHLHSLPPDQLISRTRNGRTMYLYADPTICQCVYVGTPEAYRVYQNGGPEGYVGDEANKGSPMFSTQTLQREMEMDPYSDTPGMPTLDDFIAAPPI